jgi:hypothetical protein
MDDEGGIVIPFPTKEEKKEDAAIPFSSDERDQLTLVHFALLTLLTSFGVLLIQQPFLKEKIATHNKELAINLQKLVVSLINIQMNFGKLLEKPK